MRNLLKALILMLITVLAIIITACGGSGSDSGGNGTPAGAFTKAVALSATPGNFNLGTNTQARIMMLYRANDIKGSGMINSISFKRFSAMTAAITCPNITVRMGHTDATDLEATFANNVEQGQGTFQTVISNGSLAVPSGAANDYFTISLSQPFYYNGVDNLVVEIARAPFTAAIPVSTHAAAPAYFGICFHGTSSSDPAGTVLSHVIDIKFTFAGGDNKVCYNTLSAKDRTVPFSTDLDHRRMQILYNKNEISGSGLITGIGFKLNAITTAQNYTYTMKIGHTTKSNLNILASWANNFNAGSPVTVANSVQFNLPANAVEFIWLPVPDGAFTYNGTDNLLIELTVEGTPAGTTTLAADNISTDIRLLYGEPDSAGPLYTDTGAHQIALRFYGGTMDVIGGFGSTPAWAAVFSNSGSAGLQFLVRAAELGTSGSISKLAFRYHSGVGLSAVNCQSFSVTLASNSTQNELVSTDATNIAGGTSVYNGAITIPAEINEGDWIEIPLATPFSYNGKDSLVIQTISLNSTNMVWCQILDSATLYPNLFKATGNVAPDHFRGMFRFWVNK